VKSRVDLFADIRRDRRDDPGVSTRELAKRYRVSRRTVGAALSGAVPPPRKPMPSRASLLDPAKPWIDEMLQADLTQIRM
jgi:hypothetical protein